MMAMLNSIGDFTRSTPGAKPGTMMDINNHATEKTMIILFWFLQKKTVYVTLPHPPCS